MPVQRTRVPVRRASGHSLSPFLVRGLRAELKNLWDVLARNEVPDVRAVERLSNLLAVLSVSITDAPAPTPVPAPDTTTAADPGAVV